MRCCQYSCYIISHPLNSDRKFTEKDRLPFGKRSYKRRIAVKQCKEFSFLFPKGSGHFIGCVLIQGFVMPEQGLSLFLLFLELPEQQCHQSE